MSLVSLSYQQQTFIKGVGSPIVKNYFNALNANDFDATAQLFSQQGELHPPLEQPVIGQSAIAQYLREQAKGMTLVPQEGSYQSFDNGEVEVYVQGYVQTRWFQVNVAWLFIITPHHQLRLVGVKLLASWEELAQMQG